jgi:hypothetical protein
MESNIDGVEDALPHRRKQTRRLAAGLAVFAATLFLLAVNLRYHAGQYAADDQRHPLRPRKSLRAPKESLNHVRYLAFGGSSTWGNGLSSANREAYPYLLSPEAHNAAVRSGSYSMAAACTQTIVQEDIYDIVLLEFTVFDDSITVLAQRLRERFPNATILFVQLWRPSQFKYRQDEGTVIDFQEFRAQLGNPPVSDNDLYFQVLQSGGADKWFLDILDQEQQIKRVALEVGARYLKLPVPENDIFAFPVTLHKTMELFHEDDLSPYGHSVIADSIRTFVAQSQVLERENRNQVGSWGMGDQCNLWYSHGDFQLTGTGRRLRAVEFDHAKEGHRHALEVAPEGSSFEIENPFSEDRMLYLTYMTSASESNDDELRLPYPDVRVRLNGKATVLVEPYHAGSEKVEYARTSAVGKVPSGTSVVHLHPKGSSRRHFRLVGASFLPPDVVQALPQLEFDLEAESKDVLSSIFRWF